MCRCRVRSWLCLQQIAGKKQCSEAAVLIIEYELGLFQWAGFGDEIEHAMGDDHLAAMARFAVAWQRQSAEQRVRDDLGDDLLAAMARLAVA